MGDQHIVLLAVAVFWASVDAQAFTVTPTSGYKAGNKDLELVWEFNVGTGNFIGGEWWNTEGDPVMSKIGSGNTTVINGYELKFEPIGEYGMKILNFTELDNGIYTCRMRYRQDTVTFLDDFVNVSASTIDGNALNTPYLIVAFGNDEFVLRENFAKLAVDVLTQLDAYAPINNPPLVDAVMSVSGKAPKTCFRLSDENCTMEFVPIETGNITITVTLSHPLVDSANVTWIMTVENLNTLTSSLAPDDTSISTDTPPPTKDLSVTQPSSSPTVTASDDPPRALKSGWSHWYILPIALGCLVILVVIAVVIHRRAQRKDDDLNPVTELKPPSVHAAPADHVRANTAGYRPSQHQQPRREDNTAYYVQGTSGARF